LSFLCLAPLRIHTQITATCADWSPNGLYVAVGGIRIATTENGFPDPQINMFNYEGKVGYYEKKIIFIIGTFKLLRGI